jgi:hypothetical protein
VAVAVEANVVGFLVVHVRVLDVQGVDVVVMAMLVGTRIVDVVLMSVRNGGW